MYLNRYSKILIIFLIRKIGSVVYYDFDVEMQKNGVLLNNYCVGENGKGSKILVFMLRISGTVLATTSFQPSLYQVPSRHFLRSARSE